MSKKTIALLFAVSIAGAGVVGDPAFSATPVSNLVTTYQSVNPNKIVWLTCGATSVAEGCFGSGSLVGLSNACALMDGPSTVLVNTPSEYEVTSPLYVMNAGTSAGGATLNVYNKTDTVANGFDTTTITLATQIALPLVGGAGETCYMAGNAVALFLGTSGSTKAVKVSVPGLAVSQIGGFSPALNVSQITANEGGFVAVTFGSGATTGNYVYGPTGYLVQDGGGSAFVSNNIQGVQIAPSAPTAPAQKAAAANF